MEDRMEYEKLNEVMGRLAQGAMSRLTPEQREKMAWEALRAAEALEKYDRERRGE